MEEGKINQMQVRRQDMAKLAGLYSKAMKAMPGSPKQKAISKQIDQYRKELGLDEASIYREYEPGEDYQRDLKYFQTVIKKLRGKVKSMNKPTRRDPYLEIEVDGVDAKKLRREIMKDDDGMTQIEEAVKTTHVVIDTADGNKVVATASDEKGAKASVASAERPPMNIKNKKTLKIVKLKRPVGDKQVDRMVGYPLKEAVSPAQQAAIAISKKERGEKPKNECASEDDFKPHMMYNPKTGKGVMAKKYADHVRLDKMGYVHDKPEVKEAKDDLFQVNVKGEGGATVRARSEKDAINKAFRKLGIATRFTRDKRFMTKVQVVPAESVEESRAYRDAMRSLRSKSATRGMATTKKDKDTEASDDDRKAANKNIIMQLRKAADLSTGAEIEFERGKGKVSRSQAQAALARFNALAKPRDKEKFQKSIRSLSDIKKILGR